MEDDWGGEDMLIAKVTVLVWSHKSHHSTSRVGKTMGPKMIDVGEILTAKIRARVGGKTI